MKRIVAAIFHPPMGTTQPERFVDAGRLASAEDLIRVLRSSVEEILVVEGGGGSAARLRSLGAHVVSPDVDRPFHFGEALQGLVREHEVDSLLYFGSGSGGLLSSDTIGTLIAFAERQEPGALFNNFYSCDFAVFASAPSLLAVALPENDNALGFSLSDAGIPCFSLPRSVETEFDIDTPTDLLLLRASCRGGASVRRLLEAGAFEHPTIAAICERLGNRSSFVHLSGRINPSTWGAFERQIACRTAGVIEGRGMRAYGDCHPLLLQRILREDGPTAFFGRMAEIADAAVLDTRPLLAVDGHLPPSSDRFASDLFLVEEIEDPDWRAFTAAAVNASIPVLLGGHSLVSGGLYLLAIASWKGRDLLRRLHPEPFTGRNDPT
jgi:hypothetical protein